MSVRVRVTPSGIAWECPWLRSSMTATACPASTNARTAWLPTYPAPPVTTTRATLPPDGVVREAFALHLAGLIDVPAVENHRPPHQLSHPREVGLPELLPFGDHGECVGALQRVLVPLGVGDARAE